MQDLLLFQNILLKILPLYLVILIGFVAGKFLEIDRKSIALMIMYVVAPIVFFNGIIKDNIPLQSLSISVFVFCVCTFLALIFLGLGSLIWKDSTKNILALCSSSGNMGYFGLPVALAIFGPKALPTVIMATLGIISFQNSLGFFIAANGKYSFVRSLKKTLLLPNIYAVILAFYLKDFIDIPSLSGFAKNIFNIANNFTGAYSILGMLIVGLGLSQIKSMKLNKKTFLFLILSLFAKFAIFPFLTYLFIIFDKHSLHLFSSSTYPVLMMLSLAPVPANAVVIASSLKLDTDMISITVMLSNFFALFLIPMLLVWMH